MQKKIERKKEEEKNFNRNLLLSLRKKILLSWYSYLNTVKDNIKKKKVQDRANINKEFLVMLLSSKNKDFA